LAVLVLLYGGVVVMWNVNKSLLFRDKLFT